MAASTDDACGLGMASINIKVSPCTVTSKFGLKDQSATMDRYRDIATTNKFELIAAYRFRDTVRGHASACESERERARRCEHVR